MRTRDLTVIRALYYASSGASRWQSGYGLAMRSQGVSVFRVVPNMKYGHSLNRKARLQHEVGKVFIAWRKGKIVGHLVRWRCGGTSTNFAMSNEVSQQHPTCLQCGVIGARVVMVVNR